MPSLVLWVGFFLGGLPADVASILPLLGARLPKNVGTSGCFLAIFSRYSPTVRKSAVCCSGERIWPSNCRLVIRILTCARCVILTRPGVDCTLRQSTEVEHSG